MNSLDIAFINIFSPYKVWNRGNVYYFETDRGCRYSVDFDTDDNSIYTAYWFNLNNLDHLASPNDVKIFQTVLCVIEEFFRVNPHILLYICSTAGGQQAQRARLFSYWFSKARQQERFIFKTAEITGGDPMDKHLKEYVAIIIPRSHPQAEEIIAFFNEETAMFNSMKP